MDSMTNLTDLDAVDLSNAIATGRTSCAEVMAAYLDRIDALNPGINAIVSLRPREELMTEARTADETTRKDWLHGLPFAIKDLVETAGLRSTHGSPIFADHVPTTDDLLAARIRKAGAILIGKTNTPEFGLGSNSYNPVHGVTRNPYDLSKIAGGSSGGAAAALAARLLPVADGSDMMGSLRNPAAYTNVYGFRPGYGVVPGKPSGDTFLDQLAVYGPMARNVRDLAGLLDTIAGPDRRLPYANSEVPQFSGSISASVAGRRIGWLGDWGGHYPIEPEILTLCEEALGAFEPLHVTVEPLRPGFDPHRLWSSWITLRSFSVAARLRAHYDDPAKRALLKPEAIWEIERGLALSAMEVHEASVVRSQWFACLSDVFEEFDALVLPSAQVFAFDADLHWPREVCGRTMETYHQWMEIVVPVSLVGLPALNVPAGFNVDGLPMGMQIFGKRGGDLEILQLGQAYHEATDWPNRRPPDLS